jgi:hypothetical protein
LIFFRLRSFFFFFFFLKIYKTPLFFFSPFFFFFFFFFPFAPFFRFMTRAPGLAYLFLAVAAAADPFWPQPHRGGGLRGHVSAADLPPISPWHKDVAGLETPMVPAWSSGQQTTTPAVAATDAFLWAVTRAFNHTELSCLPNPAPDSGTGAPSVQSRACGSLFPWSISSAHCSAPAVLHGYLAVLFCAHAPDASTDDRKVLALHVAHVGRSGPAQRFDLPGCSPASLLGANATVRSMVTPTWAESNGTSPSFSVGALVVLHQDWRRGVAINALCVVTLAVTGQPDAQTGAANLTSATMAALQRDPLAVRSASLVATSPAAVSMQPHHDSGDADAAAVILVPILQPHPTLVPFALLSSSGSNVLVTGSALGFVFPPGFGGANPRG